MSASHSTAGALAANIVTAVTVFGWSDGIWIENRTASTEIWATLDGSTPTVAGADCFLVTGARNFPCPNGPVTVRLISSATPSYAVSGSVPSVVTS